MILRLCFVSTTVCIQTLLFSFLDICSRISPITHSLNEINFHVQLSSAFTGNLHWNSKSAVSLPFQQCSLFKDKLTERWDSRLDLPRRCLTKILTGSIPLVNRDSLVTHILGSNKSCEVVNGGRLHSRLGAKTSGIRWVQPLQPLARPLAIYVEYGPATCDVLACGEATYKLLQNWLNQGCVPLRRSFLQTELKHSLLWQDCHCLQFLVYRGIFAGIRCTLLRHC